MWIIVYVGPRGVFVCGGIYPPLGQDRAVVGR